MAKNIPFPIRTATSCLLKWNLSTIQLTTGTTRCCYRNLRIKIPKDDFDSFHNLPYYLDHRRSMLKGEWPNSPDHLGCGYCKRIEDAGGRSDRQYMTSTKVDQTPDELLEDPTAVEVTPAILEIFLSNTCNLACTYCRVGNSSKIEAEVKKYPEQKEFSERYFGKLEDNLSREEIKEYKELCLDWLARKGTSLRRFHLLGGEPFYTPEFLEFIEIWEKHPNPDLILNVISNVNVQHSRWKTQIDKILDLVRRKKIEEFELTASLDCWGPEQEYIRSGFNSELAEQNILYYLSQPEVNYLNINSTHSLLSLPTYHRLLEKKIEWEALTGKKIRMFGMGVTVPEKYVEMDILGKNFYTQTIKKILKTHPKKDWDDREALKNLIGVILSVSNNTPNLEGLKHFVAVYNELDRRRGTNWRKIFPEIAAEVEKYKDDLV